MSHDLEQRENELHQINGHLLPLAKVYTLLDQLATNELEPDETKMMHQHLMQCQTCSQLYVEIREYHRLLHGVMSNEVPVALIDQVPEQNQSRPLHQPAVSTLLPPRPRRMPSFFRRTSARLLIAAVVFVVIVADLLIFRNVLPQSQHATSAHGTPTITQGSTATIAATPTEGLASNSPWHKLWTLPPLPSPSQATSPYNPQVAWSPANAQRLYLCQAGVDYKAMLNNAGAGYNNNPAVLHNFYRSDDNGMHWTAYALPEATGNCRIEVDPTNADALVLLDGNYHSYVSRDGGQHWQSVPDPPHWNTSLTFPVVQIMAGRLYVEGYWTDDLTHWTRWYPVADEQQHVYAQINPQHLETLYTAVHLYELHCAGTPSTLQLGRYYDPLNFQAELCRSNDGGQTWQFIAVVVGTNSSNEPTFCLALNQANTLYTWGFSKQDAASGSLGTLGEPIRSTDGGATWIHMSGAFVGGDSATINFPPCGADTYAGQDSLQVDGDDAVGEGNEWRNFGITADGTAYHVVDTTATRQGVTMTVGVSLFTNTGWSVIAPYPEGLTTPNTNYRLRMLLITPLSGGQVLLAFTDQVLYSYSGSSK
jgi:hypothetical protein